MAAIIRPKKQRRKLEERFDSTEDMARRHNIDMDRIRECTRESGREARVQEGARCFHGFGPGHKLTPGRHTLVLRNGTLVEIGV